MLNSVNLIKELSNANGISGFEDEVLMIIKEFAADCFDTKEDKSKNLYLYSKDYAQQKPTVMLDAHSDEIGFMVQSIRPNGTLRFLAIGGWFSQNVAAHKVRIRNSEGKYIPGLVASKPPHFMNKEEKNSIIEIKDMVIDVGASSREEIINKYKIEVGAAIIPDVDFQFDQANNIMLGKAFDNRLGCAAVLEAMQLLDDEDLSVNVVGAISAQEEEGIRGATITARTIKPDLAIVFEGTPADDTFRDEFDAQAALNKGPQIRHRDISLIANPELTKFARKIAQDKSIEFQDAVRLGGGTDGGRIALSNAGVPTIVIGIPVRYAHTHYGFSSLSDYTNAVKWSVEIIKNLGTLNKALL